MTIDIITEIDILDPEIAAATATVVCIDCGYSAPALDMCVQEDGEYLCPTCDYREFREYNDRMSTVRSW